MAPEGTAKVRLELRSTGSSPTHCSALPPMHMPALMCLQSSHASEWWGSTAHAQFVFERAENYPVLLPHAPCIPEYQATVCRQPAARTGLTGRSPQARHSPRRGRRAARRTQSGTAGPGCARRCPSAPAHMRASVSATHHRASTNTHRSISAKPPCGKQCRSVRYM